MNGASARMFGKRYFDPTRDLLDSYARDLEALESLSSVRDVMYTPATSNIV